MNNQLFWPAVACYVLCAVYLRQVWTRWSARQQDLVVLNYGGAVATIVIGSLLMGWSFR